MFQDGKTMSDMRETLGKDGFFVTKHQLEYILKKWGVRKRVPKTFGDATWKYIGYHLQSGSRRGRKTQVIVSGEIQNPDKVSRETRRYQPPSLASRWMHWIIHYGACYPQDVQLVSFGLAAKADINWCGEDGRTPLQAALNMRGGSMHSQVNDDCLVVVRMLLCSGASLKGGEAVQATLLGEWRLAEEIIFCDRIGVAQSLLVPTISPPELEDVEEYPERNHVHPLTNDGMSMLEAAILSGCNETLKNVMARTPAVYDAGSLCAAVLSTSSTATKLIKVLLNRRPKEVEPSYLEGLAIGIAAFYEKQEVLDLLLDAFEAPTLAAFPVDPTGWKDTWSSEDEVEFVDTEGPGSEHEVVDEPTEQDDEEDSVSCLREEEAPHATERGDDLLEPALDERRTLSQSPRDALFTDAMTSANEGLYAENSRRRELEWGIAEETAVNSTSYIDERITFNNLPFTNEGFTFNNPPLTNEGVADPGIIFNNLPFINEGFTYNNPLFNNQGVADLELTDWEPTDWEPDRN
ncbi:hypothetical protein CkaCkLH20_10482 [Colletotrichum karsti]|uniref:Clr5 domain-containing protein n=1 Tax=Colletotrichum karsti TaxID=1095194 RepID=A0A9P6LH10_9PEZI|nr:uncharacterized protein CkaCkLH20_10482 [Colletotrichum karsti]KAF9872145.1 hypothetical protein CkaCkLH20_10482 [Colletotrichum karsti]